eukprot:7501714-Karenia_brevis.AAC.1
MAIQPDEWLQGPQGLMSLGEMLEAAGYTVDRDNWMPPPTQCTYPFQLCGATSSTQPLAVLSLIHI